MCVRVVYLRPVKSIPQLVQRVELTKAQSDQNPPSVVSYGVLRN